MINYQQLTAIAVWVIEKSAPASYSELVVNSMGKLNAEIIDRIPDISYYGINTAFDVNKESFTVSHVCSGLPEACRNTLLTLVRNSEDPVQRFLYIALYGYFCTDPDLRLKIKDLSVWKRLSPIVSESKLRGALNTLYEHGLLTRDSDGPAYVYYLPIAINVLRVAAVTAPVAEEDEFSLTGELHSEILELIKQQPLGCKLSAVLAKLGYSSSQGEPEAPFYKLVVENSPELVVEEDYTLRHIKHCMPRYSYGILLQLLDDTPNKEKAFVILQICNIVITQGGVLNAQQRGDCALLAQELADRGFLQRDRNLRYTFAQDTQVLTATKMDETLGTILAAINTVTAQTDQHVLENVRTVLEGVDFYLVTTERNMAEVRAGVDHLKQMLGINKQRKLHCGTPIPDYKRRC